MKKDVFTIFLIITLLCMVIAGCSSPKQASEQSTEQEASAGKAEFVLKYNEFCPESYPPSIVAKAAAKRIEEQSGGRLKLETYFSESLLAYPDTFTGTASGIADITMIATPMLQGIFDLNTVFGLLFETEAPGRESVTAVFRELLEKYPEFQEEMEAKGTRWLDITAMDGYQLHTVDKLVKEPADMQGLKIAADGLNGLFINSMNAAAVNLAIGDYYMSLERGLVGGQLEMWPSLEANNLVPLLKHHLIFGDNVESGLCSRGYGWLINLKTWNSLPEDLQKILVENFKIAGDELVQGDVAIREKVISDVEAQGNTMTYLTPEERELWVDYMKPINAEVIKKCEEKGYPAQKIVDEMWNMFREYQ